MLGEDSLARADPWRHIRALAPPPQGECRERPQAIGPWSTSDAWVPGLPPERASPAWPPHGLTAAGCPVVPSTRPDPARSGRCGPDGPPADGAAPRRSRGTWAANHGLGFRWNLRVM
jgi:hypothetical protein